MYQDVGVADLPACGGEYVPAMTGGTVRWRLPLPAWSSSPGVTEVRRAGLESTTLLANKELLEAIFLG